MDYTHWLIIFSCLIVMSGSVAYIRDTLAGKTKPNRVTWSLWALAPLIGAGAAISGGADPWTTARILLAGLLPLLVFIFSFANPNGYWKLTLFDLACGAFSLLALFLWLSTNSTDLAILFSAIADGFASLPTLKKAWTNPETETGFTYIASFASVLMVLPSIPEWSIENSAFQIYLIIANGLLMLVVYRKRIFQGSPTL